MIESAAFLHELTLEGSAETESELDDWIAGFVDQVRDRPGFVRADAWPLQTGPDRIGRLVQVRITGEEDWAAYRAGPDVGDEITALFDAKVEVQSRMLTGAIAVGSAPQPRCANCDAQLSGQYCGQCGQRARGRLIRLPELLRDAFGDLFELDSRLWRTLIPLAIRPGLLTRDYLLGRRVRYMPPFRMYLVLSLLFFLVAFFNPRDRLQILFEDQPAAGPAASEVTDEPDGDITGLDVVIENDSENADCDFEDYDPANMPGWLSRRITRDRLVAACNNVFTEDGGGIASLLDRMVENIPAGLFVLLPVMALLLMALHPLSGRYYVEHLLFVVHFHSFIFLILTIDVAIARASTAFGWPETPGEVAAFATVIYLPVYLYKSLRRVYESGRWITVLRFLFLSFSYFVGLVIIVGVAALIAAFTV